MDWDKENIRKKAFPLFTESPYVTMQLCSEENSRRKNESFVIEAKDAHFSYRSMQTWVVEVNLTE